jgi:hypothetical protein
VKISERRKRSGRRVKKKGPEWDALQGLLKNQLNISVMATKIIRLNKPPRVDGVFEISMYEKELPFLKAQGLQFEVMETIEPTKKFLRIRLEIKDSYQLSCFGIAMSKCGFEDGKAQWLNSRLVDHNPAIEQSIEDILFKNDFEHERFQVENYGHE